MLDDQTLISLLDDIETLIKKGKLKLALEVLKKLRKEINGKLY